MARVVVRFANSMIYLPNLAALSLHDGPLDSLPTGTRPKGFLVDKLLAAQETGPNAEGKRPWWEAESSRPMNALQRKKLAEAEAEARREADNALAEEGLDADEDLGDEQDYADDVHVPHARGVHTNWEEYFPDMDPDWEIVNGLCGEDPESKKKRARARKRLANRRYEWNKWRIENGMEPEFATRSAAPKKAKGAGCTPNLQRVLKAASANGGPSSSRKPKAPSDKTKIPAVMPDAETIQEWKQKAQMSQWGVLYTPEESAQLPGDTEEEKKFKKKAQKRWNNILYEWRKAQAAINIEIGDAEDPDSD